MHPLSLRYEPELSPGRAAVLEELRERARRRRESLADLALGATALGVSSWCAAVVPGLLDLDLGSWGTVLRTAAVALLVVGVAAADRVDAQNHSAADR